MPRPRSAESVSRAFSRSVVDVLRAALMGAALGGCMFTSGGTLESPDAGPDAEPDAKVEPDGGAPGDGGGSKPDAKEDADAAGEDAAPAGDAMVGEDGGPDGAKPPPKDGGKPPADAEVDADADATPDDADTPEDADAGECKLDGRFALRVDAHVEWASRTAGIFQVVTAGEGDLSVVLAVDVERDADSEEVRGEVRPCGLAVPDFVGPAIFNSERFGLRFEPDVWESPDFPAAPLYARSKCVEAGCVLDPIPMQLMIGASLDNPIDPWPASASALTFVDHDMDGQAGVTATCKMDDGYFELPVGGPQSRASHLMLGARVQVDPWGELRGCDGYDGVANGFQIEALAADCTLSGGAPGSCNTTLAESASNSIPEWKTVEATFEAVRVADDASCAAIRAAAGME